MNRFGYVVGNMGEITVKPERKPEQWRQTDGNGDFDGLALRSCVLKGGIDGFPIENVR